MARTVNPWRAVGDLELVRPCPVQLPEPIIEDTEAYKAGFRNIAELGKERIRRAIKKMKAEKKNENENR